MDVVAFKYAYEDDARFDEITAWRYMPALADDMNLGTRPVDESHEALRAQEPIAE